MTPLALAEWGLAGVEALRVQVAALVLVDVLSFSTAVDIAASRSALVLPFPEGGNAEAAAARAGAVLARRRGEGGFSLSPASLQAIPAGTRLLLPSPNGSRLAHACRSVPVLLGCLRNAAAVAAAARHLAGGGAVGVVPAGERWPDGGLRPAVEDLLGAGAVLHHLDLPPSPEAQVARDAFRAAGADLPRLVRESLSGQELMGRGFSEDVALALQVGESACVPVLRDGAFRAA